MKKLILALMFVGMILPAVYAQNQDDRDNDRSSELTPTAQRKVTMASPEKPAWQSTPHGK